MSYKRLQKELKEAESAACYLMLKGYFIGRRSMDYDTAEWLFSKDGNFKSLDWLTSDALCDRAIEAGWNEIFIATTVEAHRTPITTIDEAETSGKLSSVYAQDAKALGYYDYDSYLDEECK